MESGIDLLDGFFILWDRKASYFFQLLGQGFGELLGEQGFWGRFFFEWWFGCGLEGFWYGLGASSFFCWEEGLCELEEALEELVIELEGSEE